MQLDIMSSGSWMFARSGDESSISKFVPKKCILRELHTSHPGIVKMKSLAHVHVWWPGIDKCIEHLVKECETCESVRINPSSLHLWSWLDAPWKRILLVYFKDLSLWSL